MLAPWYASRNRTFLLETGRCQVVSDGCSPHGMLLETERCQVGSDGCSSHGMLLETGRCQVGSDGSPHRMLRGRKREKKKTSVRENAHVFASDASRTDQTDVSRISCTLCAKTHNVFAFKPLAAAATC